MAAGGNLCDVRTEETLKIRIGEAKNLQPRKEPRYSRNCYCIVTLDQEEVFRTATVEKSLCPFFGEDVHFEVPRNFRTLSFYLFDTDLIGKDTVLGKVAIKKDIVQNYHTDTWLPLVHVEPDTEVQGRINLEIKQYEFIPDTDENEFSNTPKLSVRILECTDLFGCNGNGTFSDPYVNVSIQGPLSRSEPKKTKVKKRTLNPKFEESFLFEIPPDDVESLVLRCAAWSASLIGEDIFLGEVRVPLSKCDLSSTHEGWYWLGPREDKSEPPSKQDLGSLRLRVCHTEDHVFPSNFYDPLREAILGIKDGQDVRTMAAHILGELVKDKGTVARSFVRVFSHHDQVVDFIKLVVDHEVRSTKDPNTLFRGNSLATKSVDEFMKHAGMYYLHDTIKCLVDEIYDDRKHCEIDPAKLREAESLEANLVNLRGYVNRIFAAITCSAMACPTVMCQVFHNIKETATMKFPDDNDVCYTSVSGFVFLRFFAPAILNPKLFQMRNEHPDPQTSRTLTLISKAIQSLGNVVSSVLCGQVKEPYMETLKSVILDQEHITAVKRFLEVISSPSRAQGLPVDSTIVLKEGMLSKRAQGRSHLVFKNNRKRFFVLTNKGLSYSKDKTKATLGHIPVSDILGAERLGEASFHMKLMVQIIQPDKLLYIQASNTVAEREWIRALRRVCQSNPHRAKKYHPEAYVGGKWLCCKERAEKSEGCTPITEVPQPKCVNVAIDCDREMERIHSLFLVYLEKLDELQSECESQCENCTVERTDPELWKQRLMAINDIRSHVISLEQEHKQHRKITHRLTRHGSKELKIWELEGRQLSKMSLGTDSRISRSF
ncbi:ras GTPase-activating protein 3-like isoform X1 [Acropora muricata]|uniref:ras GTPase-activating protein 3-like isoform X1 n=1 Tax=Acropora muricata TaxID=159855 RepID=UPI0034E50D2E